MIEQRILVTGSAGLIGRNLTRVLRESGMQVIPFDLRGGPPDARGDVREPAALARAIEGATGIVHLAAVSRVIDGERDPDRCWSTNVEATRALLELALRSARRPWLIYASSREVYGQQDALPVREDAPQRPMNVYGRSKAEAERQVDLAQGAGLRAAVLRFSNVYGDTLDHADRVIPAFARAAALGGTLRVDGAGCTFDFTHVGDVVEGIGRVVRHSAGGDGTLPPLHFVSGLSTSLGDLAALAMELGVPGVSAVHATARDFDVHRFTADPGRAQSLIGWRATTSLRSGFSRLMAAYRAAHDGAGH